MAAIGLQGLLDAMPGVSYVVDRKARILAVGAPNWRSFANDNDGAAIAAPEGLIGRDLLAAIEGEDVRNWYGAALARLLSGASAPLHFAYRCDSATTRRLMMMSMSAVPMRGRPAGVLFQSLTLDQTTRPALPLFRPNRLQAALRAQKSWPIVTVCSFCARVRMPPKGDWVEPEEYYRAGGRSRRIRVSHGLCPTCAAAKFGGTREPFPLGEARRIQAVAASTTARSASGVKGLASA